MNTDSVISCIFGFVVVMVIGILFFDIFREDAKKKQIEHEVTEVSETKVDGTPCVDLVEYPGALQQCKLTNMILMGKCEEGFIQYGIDE